MTDITELAQSLKAAAEKATPGNWRAFQYHDGRCGVGGGNHDEIMVCEHISKKRPHDALFIAMANPTNVLALVEALEKAQTKAIEQGRTACELFDEVTALRQRIDELESRTVKLPKAMSIEGGAYCSAHAHYDSDGDYYDRTDVEEMLAAAGIKVEAE
ncbi:ead/Ea22-like family protein [Klebsiella grimontii]|uniref:ead/Ea22-like family protein n=1 Tax=Klebsiella grimontii TaxID=2058152 RepID=UPI003100C292